MDTILKKIVVGAVILLGAQVCISAAPYPPSPVIASVTIGPEQVSIGNGDNFPFTWAADGTFWNMYMDGKGFGGANLSNGLSKITGTPPSVSGQNVSSPGIEFTGGGKSGRKASGLVCVKGVIYCLLRNLTTSGTGMSLYWSSDNAKTWQHATWNWPGVGMADWINMGQDYRENTDGYAYWIGGNTNSAYSITDDCIMARVPIGSIKTQSAYEYFAGMVNGSPTWAKDFASRKPVITIPGKCYRVSEVYNPGIKRFIFATLPWNSSGSYSHYLGIFDAPNPWGPWTTALEYTSFSQNRYHPRFPNKFFSSDGKTMWYNYSDLNHYRYNLSKVTLTLHQQTSGISFDASSSANAAAKNTVSWPHIVGTGVNRMLTVGISTEDAAAADMAVKSVTFNGVALTKVIGSYVQIANGTAGPFESSVLFYLANPPSGSHMVTVITSGTCDGISAGSISLANVSQDAPEAVKTNSVSGAGSISTTITTRTNNAWIIDAVDHSTSSASLSAGSGMTEQWSQHSANESGAGSTYAAGAAGSKTLKWTASVGARMTHSLAAFKPSSGLPKQASQREYAQTTPREVTFGISNPSRNVYALSAPASAWYTVTDVSGKQIMRGTIINAESRLDLSQVSKGIYMIKFASQSRQMVSKIVVR